MSEEKNEDSGVQISAPPMNSDEMFEHIDAMHLAMRDAAVRYIEEHGLFGLAMTVCATGYLNPETGEPMTPYRTIYPIGTATVDQLNTLISISRQVYILACAAELEAQRDIVRAQCADVEGGLN